MASMKTHESKTKSSRIARLDLRITLKQKKLLARAAALLGRSLTNFVVASACETAARTLREHEAVILSDRDRKVFVSALLNPLAPGVRLRKAVRRYGQHFIG